MGLVVFALFHLLHFIVDTDEQVVELGLVAAFPHVESIQSLGEHRQQALNVLVVSLLLLSSCKPTIHAHLLLSIIANNIKIAKSSTALLTLSGHYLELF